MQSLKVVSTVIASVLGVLALSACGRHDQAASAPDANAAAAAAAASSAQASASDAETSAALARARVPAAGTVANAAGDNQKTSPPRVTVAEEAQATGDEAPQELRNRVNAAKDAQAAPKH